MRGFSMHVISVAGALFADWTPVGPVRALRTPRYEPHSKNATCTVTHYENRPTYHTRRTISSSRPVLHRLVPLFRHVPSDETQLTVQPPPNIPQSSGPSIEAQRAPAAPVGNVSIPPLDMLNTGASNTGLSGLDETAFALERVTREVFTISVSVPLVQIPIQMDLRIRFHSSSSAGEFTATSL
jgi:hypothetical protein